MCKYDNFEKRPVSQKTTAYKGKNILYFNPWGRKGVYLQLLIVTKFQAQIWYFRKSPCISETAAKINLDFHPLRKKVSTCGTSGSFLFDQVLCPNMAILKITAYLGNGFL